MSVFLQMSLVGVGDILWVLRSTLRTHIPCEGGWLRCRSSSLLVNEWFRRGVAESQSFGHRRFIHWKYGRSMWGTRWELAQDVCGCGLVGWEPISLTQVDSALPYFLSKDVCSLGRWIAFPAWHDRPFQTSRVWPEGALAPECQTIRTNWYGMTDFAPARGTDCSYHIHIHWNWRHLISLQELFEKRNRKDKCRSTGVFIYSSCNKNEKPQAPATATTLDIFHSANVWKKRKWRSSKRKETFHEAVSTFRKKEE